MPIYKLCCVLTAEEQAKILTLTHASLPQYRGASTTIGQIINMETKQVLCLLMIQIDTGEIIFTRRIVIEDAETVSTFT
jgi:methionyl-tRNA formyltransferase